MTKFFLTLLFFMSLCTPALAEKLIVEDSKIAIMDLGTHEGALPFEINIFNAGTASEVGKFNIMDKNFS